MKLLHLVQPLPARDTWWSPAPAGVSGEAALLALHDVLATAVPTDAHYIVTLGGSASQQLARDVGLQGIISLSPPLGRSHRAGPALRRLLNQLGHIDAIIAWGTASAAALARIPQRRAIAHLCVDMHSGVLAPIASVSSTSGFDRPPHHRGIILPWRTTSTPTSPARHERARFSARRALDLHEHETTVLLATDAACPAFAPDVMLALSALSVSAQHVTLLLPRRCHQLRRALRTVHEHGYVGRVILTDSPLITLAPAADLALLAPHKRAIAGAQPHEADAVALDQPLFASGQLWKTCARAGVPCVVPSDLARSLDIAELCCTAPSCRATDQSRGMLPLIESPGLRAQLAQRAIAALQAPDGQATDLLPAGPSLGRCIETLHLAGTT